jgi:2-C-methyl-D-erythritol 4-phosphate cytidylyltransferase
MKERNIAIVLAAGQGKRMQSKVQKQYLHLKGKPVLYYALQVFETCSFIDEIILVTGAGEMEFCQKEIVEVYGFQKVKKIVAGGKERYHSVFEGLKAVKELTEKEEGTPCYVYIHDGARPFVDEEILQRTHRAVCETGACVAGMPVKDTIKISDGTGMAVETPRRELVWMIQTPQVFSYELIYEAYAKLLKEEHIFVTDDAMVLECMEGQRVKLVEGSYRNMKITTPEDLAVAEALLKD